MIIEKTAGGVVIKDNKVIIVFQNKTKTWALPKGHIDGDETEEQAAIREIWEEAGVEDLSFIKKLGSYSRGSKKDINVKKNISILHFTTNQEDLKPIDAENPIAKWVDINEVGKILSYIEDRDFFLKIKDKL